LQRAIDGRLVVAQRFAGWLTPRRLTAQAVVLAVCLWSVAVIDFATPGVMDRAGNVKFQDFLQFYVSGTLVREDQSNLLFDEPTAVRQMHAIAPQWKSSLPRVYGPQVGMFFAPFARFPFLTAAAIWVIFSSGLYLLYCYLIWNTCPGLREHPRLLWLLAAAYPPFFHFVVRGQLAALVLACFAAAYFAFRAHRPFLAGLALGCLVFKPQFLVAIPIVFLLAGAWSSLAGTVLAAAGQLAIAWIGVGTETMRQYALTLTNARRLVATTEVDAIALAQLHSLRSFWAELVPWHGLASFLYFASSVTVVCLAVQLWKSAAPLAFRFSGLLLAAALVNPHLFVYDLLALAPVLLLLGDWCARNPEDPATAMLRMLLYAVFLSPLLGPITLFTHLQLSVLAMIALEWSVWRAAMNPTRSESTATA
jgi:Glycosyltransferase family 87